LALFYKCYDFNCTQNVFFISLWHYYKTACCCYHTWKLRKDQTTLCQVNTYLTVQLCILSTLSNDVWLLTFLYPVTLEFSISLCFCFIFLLSTTNTRTRNKYTQDIMFLTKIWSFINLYMWEICRHVTVGLFKCHVVFDIHVRYRKHLNF
jgi:hypothetical protein